MSVRFSNLKLVLSQFLPFPIQSVTFYLVKYDNFLYYGLLCTNSIHFQSEMLSFILLCRCDLERELYVMRRIISWEEHSIRANLSTQAIRF